MSVGSARATGFRSRHIRWLATGAWLALVASAGFVPEFTTGARAVAVNGHSRLQATAVVFRVTDEKPPPFVRPSTRVAGVTVHRVRH